MAKKKKVGPKGVMHLKEKKGKIWRFFFWLFLLIGLFKLSNFIYPLKLGLLIGTIIFPLLFFYLGYQRIQNKGIQLKFYKEARNCLIIFILLLFAIPISTKFIFELNLFSCKPPKTEIGIRCCIPSKEMPVLCEDEAKVFEEKLIYAIENEIVTKNIYVLHEKPNFKFRPPKGYYSISDIKVGGIDVPFYLIAYGETENEYIEISSRYIYGNVNKTMEEMEQEMQEGIYAGVKKFSNVQVRLIKKEWIQTENNLLAHIIEMTILPSNLDSEEIYLKMVVFTNLKENYIVGIYFSSTERYISYVDEFDEMINSFTFE